MLEKIIKFNRIITVLNKRIKDKSFIFGDEFKLEFDLLNRQFFNKYSEDFGLTPIENSYVKKSDTVFILGSGETLADLTDEEWKHISKHDSIGVNMSIVHDFPVNYQFWEVRENMKANELFFKVVKKKKSKGVPFEVVVNNSFVYFKKSFELNSFKKNKNLLSFYFDTVYLTMNSPSINKLKALYAFLRMKDSSKVVHHRTHIGAVLDFAYLQGYKKAVLIGCDLNGGKYFHQVESASKIYQENEFYKEFEYCIADEKRQLSKKGISGSEHVSMLSSLEGSQNSLIALDYFKAIKDCYMNPFKVYVTSKKSALNKFYDIYDFSDHG